EAASMMTELRMLDVRNRQQWRTWLGKHHALSSGVWLVFYKKHTPAKSIPYEDSVRVALCFGWIDSLIKRLHDDRYALKFTPRQPTVKSARHRSTARSKALRLWRIRRLSWFSPILPGGFRDGKTFLPGSAISARTRQFKNSVTTITMSMSPVTRPSSLFDMTW